MMCALIFGCWKTNFIKIVHNDSTKNLTAGLFPTYVFRASGTVKVTDYFKEDGNCLLYTSPSPRDKRQSRMPSSA